MAENQEDFAGRVFLLMGKEYRISRSIRAQWFFQHINSLVYPKSNQDLLTSREELEVLSVLPEISNIHSAHSFRLAPSTRITFIGRQYRFVFCLDISPSEGTVNAETGKTLLEEVFDNFMNCISALIEPFSVPGSNLVLEPELVVTILAHTPMAHKTCQVLVQGLTISRQNIYDILYEVKSKVQTLEDLLSNEITKRYEQSLASEADAQENGDILNSAESSLINMVRDALLALEVLPDNASAGIVIVTDGVFNLKDASVVDAVLAQMRTSTVVCSFLHVGGGVSCGFGYIPNTSLMQFIATATSGAYMSSCPKVTTTELRRESTENEAEDGMAHEAQPMNIYHEALLCWNFHTDTDRGKIANDSVVEKTWMRKSREKESNRSLLPQPLQKIKHSETKHSTRISSVLSVRLREGYSIENVAIAKGGTELEVKLTLPWKEHVFLEYIAKAAWPLDQQNRSTHVDVFVEGSYDFLVDITAKQKCKSVYRETVVYKFEQTMKSLQATDEMLVRLQSFSINPSYTTIPDSAKDGVPLFHLPQSSKTPVLSLQQGKSKKFTKSHEALFAEYWRPILFLDTKIWQKWFHCHRISILLENDRPISKSLFMPSTAERFHTVLCRTALNALNRILREWTSFVLLENNSYIKFLEGSAQKMPYSFCILRLVFKGLCVVIRLAFLGGTAGTERNRVVSDLKKLLKSIKAPLKKPLFSPEHTLSTTSHTKTVTLQTKEKRCVIFLEKPLERILVKYDSIPDDLKFAECKASDNDQQEFVDVSQPSSRMSPVLKPANMSTTRSSTLLSTLSRYMYNQRWIWKMSCQTKDLPIGEVAAVLYAITKRRLLEGFHFCSSNPNGVITMVKEVSMQRLTSKDAEPRNVCVLQYVLFPPHRCVQIRDGYQDDSVESEAIRDARSELQFATEIWVEPQSGVVRETIEGFKYTAGMKYNEIPQKIFQNDFQTVKEMVTYFHLEGMCIDSLLTTVPPPLAVDMKPPSDWSKNSTVVEVPFLFDIVSLLAKSNQVSLLLPLLKDIDEMTCNEQRPNDTLLSLFFSSLTDLVDCEVPLTAGNCEAFSTFLKETCKAVEDHRTNTHFQVNIRDDPVWKCYAGASRRTIIIVIIPATLDDIRKVDVQKSGRPSTSADETIGTVPPSGDHKEGDGNILSGNGGEQETASQNDSVRDLRDSVNSDEMASEKPAKCRPYVPIFIYECKFATISDIQSKPGEVRNVFIDLRAKLGGHSGENNIDEATVHFEDSVDGGEGLAELSAFCKILSDRFFQTFVNGVFKNLQLGFALNSDEVESSVEMICEESCLEIDITSFIRIICMHFRKDLIDDEVFDPMLESNLIVKRPGKHSSGSTAKSTPRTPVSAIPKCGSETVHKFVQNSFLEILQTKFNRVPLNGELFYYSSSDEQQVFKDDDSISDAESDIQEADLDVVNDIFGSTENLPSEAKNRDDRDDNNEEEDNISSLSRVSIKGSTTSLSAIETAEERSEVESIAFDDSEAFSSQHPLFLHLMCSIRDRSVTGSEIGLIPVNTLPTCLAEILRLLEDGGNLISPCSSSLKVTLDLICLTLPPEVESGKSWKVANEGTLTHDASEMDDGFLVDEHGSIAEDQFKQGVFELNDDKEIVSTAREKASTLIDNTLTDPLKTLPKAQLNAFKVIVKRIEWLLKDEIASALINSLPITEATLDNVADHVKNSTTENCQSRCISLRFVCGVEKSLQLFLAELSKAKISQFRLASKGKYFYLTGDDSDMPDNRIGSKNNDSIPSSSEDKSTEDGQRDRNGEAELDAEGIMLKSDEKLIDVYADETGKDTEEYPIEVDTADTYRFCQQIILDAFDLSMKNKDKCARSDNSRLRSGSLPLPPKENGDIVRRRFSDTGISYSKNDDLSLDLEEFFPDLQSFEAVDTPRKRGPNFWLFASVQGSEVAVFLHKRREAADSGDIESEKCYIDLLGMINTIARLVNQKMLLDDLYDTFTCHNLLVAEEDEQIWSRRESSPAKPLFLSGKSEMGMSFEFVKVIHGEFEFHPGYFECDKVWETFLSVHYRLKSSPGQPKGTSRAIQAIRAVLERFAVSNRSNMFVYRENSGSVFYFRIHENFQELEPSQLSNVVKVGEEEQLKEENFSYHSAASSTWSLARRVQQEDKEDQHEDADMKDPETKYNRGNSIIGQVEKDSVSELSFSTVSSVQRIQFCVHGICEPGSDIKDELVKVLKNKLNDAVFEQLNLLIARNPKCRLAPTDVQFIQPPGQAPAATIYIAIPKIALPYTHSTVYYLRQYLLQRFHTPRFTENFPEFHFKNYRGSVSSFASDEPLPLNDVYLYNRREKKGCGIGCIHMSLTDAEHRQIRACPTQYRVRPDVYEAQFYWHTLKEFNNVRVVNDTKLEQGGEEDLYFEFKIWERGSVGIEELQEFLLCDVRKAMSDIFIEFFILYTPICEVPSHLQSHYALKAQGRGSQTTTPTSLKTDSRSATPVSSTPYPRLIAKKYLSEPATPAELRARSPVPVLRNRSLNEIPVREPLARKSSKESPRDIAKKNQIETIENIEKTYETLEEYFPLNSSENRSVFVRKSDSDDASIRETLSTNSESHLVSIQEVERLLPADDNQFGSSYDTMTDKEVEESFSSTVIETDDSGKDVSEKKDLTWKEIEKRKRSDKESRRIRRRFERGEAGFLHPCFDQGIDLVLDEMISQNSLSVHKHTGMLDCKYTPEQILKETLKILSDLASNVTPKVFKESSSPLRVQAGCKKTLVFVPHSFDRSAVKVDDYGESTTDDLSALHPVSVVPGYKTRFIVVGRNIRQWRHCINLNESISDDEEKVYRTQGFSKQLFKPLDPDSSYSIGKPLESLAPSYIKVAFIPRQKFYIVKFVDREIVTYTYNFPMEDNALLHKQLNRLYAWHNARTHLSSCLAIQKLGLFHHLHFTEEKQTSEETASFCSSTNHSHIISLLKETFPSSREKTKNVQADASKMPGIELPSLDETFRNTAPTRPLHKENYRLSNDPVKRIGYQYQEITRTKINIESQKAKIKEILETWHVCGPHMAIFENRLSLLKRFSRFIHFCQTPLLFSNSSASSTIEQNTRKVESGKLPSEKEKTDKDNAEGEQQAVTRDENLGESSNEWYNELKWIVMQKYIQYLQTLGFCVVQIQTGSKGQQAKNQKGLYMARGSSKSTGEAVLRVRPSVQYLQKGSKAGILLLELSYRGDNLCLRMFSYEASRLKSLNRFVTINEHWLFQEDCNRHKDLMHIHSFAYDFQLRQAQQFLSGRNMIFYPGYPVQKLFERMMEIFPTPPKFSCCYLAQGTVSIPCSAELETKEVFKYLSINAEKYKMDPAKITKITDSGMNTDPAVNQTILSYMYYTSKSQNKGEFQKMASGSRRDSADFDGNVILTLSPSQDKEVLNLKFFLVLTNRREFYPRRSLKCQLSSLRSRRKRTLSGNERPVFPSSSDESQNSVGARPRVRFSIMSTTDQSVSEVIDKPQDMNLKVPTWPGTLPPSGSSSPKAISSPSSDTILIRVRDPQNEYEMQDQERLARSPSSDPHIPRSSSNDSISSSSHTQVAVRKSSSSGQLAEKSESVDANFLATEVAFVRSRLSKVAGTCLSNCWRDFMWYKLLLMDGTDEEILARKYRKKTETRKESFRLFVPKWKLAGVLNQIRKEVKPKISLSEFKLLLGLVTIYPISSIDKRMDSLLTLLGNSKPQKQAISRVLSSRFGDAYREFAMDESSLRYICLLNHSDLDMFVLVTIGPEGLVQNIQVVYREEPTLPPFKDVKFTDLKKAELPSIEFIESVMSCICYHVWSLLLPV